MYIVMYVEIYGDGRREMYMRWLRFFYDENRVNNYLRYLSSGGIYLCADVLRDEYLGGMLLGG